MTKQHLHVKWQACTDQVCVLNLDRNFSPFKSTEGLFFLDFKNLVFKGGEPLFQITTDPEILKYPTDLIITHRYNSTADLVDIVVATDAARRLGFKNIKLILPYFPAARQDRVCNVGESLTLKVFADMINGCGFDEVTILCPHSEVTPALLNNCTVLDELDFTLEVVKSNEYTPQFNIVCPDAGAGKRVGKVVKYLFDKNDSTVFNLIRCEKERDVKDGSLKGFYVQADDLGGHPTLIVDDIVSMGGTFIGLGEELKKKNCGKLMLYTTHADCVEGLVKMVDYFDHVYTTNSRRNWDAFIGRKNFTTLPITL